MDFLPCGMYSMADSTLPDSVDGHSTLPKKRYFLISINRGKYLTKKYLGTLKIEKY